ncbi:thioesterase family protein [Evansella halocellulosilytica]|uniref:thioesterase family protein n=1 Tax=Evansella halocellulosilytica TaxID=2011013 RepID=UPI000BB82C9F|nr:thioesterase family protein [Evansella halocellulosilytica]
MKPFHFSTNVRPEWVDYNGHMNDAEYARVFSLAVDALIEAIGLDENAREKESYTIFTLETHICYLQEAHEKEELSVHMQLLNHDTKRLHIFFSMKNSSGDLIATSEQMLMGINTKANRPAPFPEAIMTTVETMMKDHDQLEVPKQAGRTIGIKK